jgi:hypothetical protein
MRSGWCNTVFHSDGKRRFGQLVRGLCFECRTRIKQTPECKEIERQITLLENRKEDIDQKISNLRYRLNLLYEQETKPETHENDSPLPKKNLRNRSKPTVRKGNNASIQYQQLSINP